MTTFSGRNASFSDIATPNRVPAVTADFWLIKLMAVTMGETAADFLAVNLGLGLTATSLLMGAILIGALVLQFKQKRYVPWSYWLAVVLVSIVGTLITDNMVDNFGISLVSVTTFFVIALGATFTAWYASEKTLSIHDVTTTKREAFYWLAILMTFALGTGAGQDQHRQFGQPVSCEHVDRAAVDHLACGREAVAVEAGTVADTDRFGHVSRPRPQPRPVR